MKKLKNAVYEKRHEKKQQDDDGGDETTLQVAKYYIFQ